MEAKKQLIKLGFYDEKNCKFMAADSISFEDLYSQYKDKIKKDDIDNEFIQDGDFIYLYNNPHIIHFILPCELEKEKEEIKKEIFVANMNQFSFLNEKFGFGFKITISDDSINYSNGLVITECFKAKYIKYVNAVIDKNDFICSNKYLSNKDSLGLNDLSINYKYYLENSNLVDDDNNFFINSEKRKEFFELLNKYIKNKDKLLALCGLEGIGKTVSILGYLKKCKLSYYYFNVKAIDKLLSSNKNQEVIKVLLTETYNFIEFSSAQEYYNLIKQILNKNSSVMNVLNEIINIIQYKVVVIVVDQYEAKYDENYTKLKNIINMIYSKMIIISSMNEDDIRNSILLSIKSALNINDIRPLLDYYYIIDLVKVSKDDLNKFNEKQKKLLGEFGNLYTYYYKIKNLINNEDYLEKEFKNGINKEMDNKVQEYFKNRQNSELFHAFKYLIMNDNEEMSLKDCYQYFNNIPLRYYSLKHANKNINKFSDLNIESKISFNSAYNYIIEYFLYYLRKTWVEIHIKGNDISYRINQEAINLEYFFGYFLWGFRNKEILKDIKIKAYQKVNSIFEMNENSINSLKNKIKNLGEGESILLIQENQNAKIFDVGILERKKKGYNLYLFQVTNKKESNERVTLTELNDNINYLNGYFSFELGIEFKNNYFCYIFNYKNPDKATITYCIQNNINYLLFDLENLSLQGDLKLKPLNYELPILKYSDNFCNIIKMIKIDKLQFSECESNKKDNLKVTKEFLTKKRKLMNDKSFSLKELNELKSYESSLNNNVKNTTNYERKEFIINNYLLSNKYKNKKIYGVSYKKNKKNCDLITFTENEKKNLFNLCKKDLNNDNIFLINEVEIYNFNVKPEFGCFIIFDSTAHKKFYFDFTNQIYYNLEDNTSESLINKILVNCGKFYSIIFLNKNISIA